MICKKMKKLNRGTFYIHMDSIESPYFIEILKYMSFVPVRVVCQFDKTAFMFTGFSTLFRDVNILAEYPPHYEISASIVNEEIESICVIEKKYPTGYKMLRLPE